MPERSIGGAVIFGLRWRDFRGCLAVATRAIEHRCAGGRDRVGQGTFAKRLERGRLIWPTPVAGIISISASTRIGLESIGKILRNTGDRDRLDELI